MNDSKITSLIFLYLIYPLSNIRRLSFLQLFDEIAFQRRLRLFTRGIQDSRWGLSEVDVVPHFTIALKSIMFHWSIFHLSVLSAFWDFIPSGIFRLSVLSAFLYFRPCGVSALWYFDVAVWNSALWYFLPSGILPCGFSPFGFRPFGLGPS